MPPSQTSDRENQENNRKIGKAKEKEKREKRRKGKGENEREISKVQTCRVSLSKSLDLGRHEVALQVQVPGWEIGVRLYIYSQNTYSLL